MHRNPKENKKLKTQNKLASTDNMRSGIALPAVHVLKENNKAKGVTNNSIIQRASINGITGRSVTDFRGKGLEGFMEFVRENVSHIDVINELLNTSTVYDTLDDFKAAFASRFTSDRSRAAMPTNMGEDDDGPELNVRGGGPISGLHRGIGDGYKAGIGAAWHVHFDHITYGSDESKRVDFRPVDTASAIIQRLKDKGAEVLFGKEGWDLCVDWLKRNFPDG